MKSVFKKFGKNEDGFSIIELMVVIAIIAVVTAIAVPSFISYGPHAQLKTSSRQIYVALQSARIKAVGSKAEYGIRFDLSVNPVVYRLMTRANAAATWVKDPTSTNYEISKSVNIDNITVGATNYTTGVSGVVGFTPLGSSTGATVQLRVGTGEDKYSVMVSASTGRVKIKVGW